MQINQHVWDNWRISTDQTAPKMSSSHGKKQCKNGLRTQPKTFYFHGINELDCWMKFTGEQGNCIEK
jgi:hypothetical protein